MNSGKSDMPVERDSATPMYRQLADTMRERIVRGDFPPGAALPTERELMVKHDLSRVTVRLAMDVLMNQGLIIRQRGKGTFVAPQRVRHDLSVLSGFYDALSAQGVEPTTVLRDFRVLDRAAAGELALPYERNVYVERTYLIEQQPIAIVRAVLHPRAATIERALAETHPNYSILTNLLSFVVARADVSIRAALPDAEIAAALGIELREPVLVLDRTSFAPGDVPIEKSSFSIRSDRYEFALALREGHTVEQAIRPQRSGPRRAAAVRPSRRTRT